MKRIMIAALLGSVATTGFTLAQTAAPGTTTEPATQAQGAGTQTGTAQESDATSGSADAAMSENGGTAMQSEGGFFTYQEGNQMLGSGLMGAEVWGAEGESIGSVDDLLLDDQGQVVAVVVGVGGFLGIGEKDVAIANDQLEFVLAEDAAAAAPAASGTAVAPTASSPAGTATTPAETPTATGTPTTGTAAGGVMGATDGRQVVGMQPGMGYGWNWTGAGIDHIEVSFTREQLEGAPEFEAAE